MTATSTPSAPAKRKSSAIITATGTAPPIIVTGLTFGVNYIFTVLATNAVGPSPTIATISTVSPCVLNTATAASSSPTLTVNTILTNITHATTIATGIGTAIGLPAGVTASWLAGTITISGTPTVTGTFTYTIPLTGGCGSVNATGTITVNAATSAILATTAVSSITATGASSGGTISSDGGGPITAKGVVWSTSTAPTVSLTTKTTDGTGTGTFTSTISGLVASTTYYVRAYATNAAGTSYGTELTFSTSAAATVPGAPTSVTAVAGNTQATVSFTAPTSDGGSAITGYTVTSNGGSVVITATHTTSPITVTGLANGTAYTFTVVASNAVGNSIPSAASAAVTPAAPFVCGTSTITDVDNNSYNTVSVGTQCWTKENLRVRKYNDGTAIPFNTSGGTAGNVSSTWNALAIGAHTLYAHDSTSNLTNYGYLYNYYAAAGIITAGGTSTKNICPTGYHVPTDAEWTTLTTHLDGELVAGGKMKQTGTTLWNTPNTGADNTSGFTALPGGCRWFDGSFFSIRASAFFWSATEYDSGGAWLRYQDSNVGNVFRSNFEKSVGASVRCLRD